MKWNALYPFNSGPSKPGDTCANSMNWAKVVRPVNKSYFVEPLRFLAQSEIPCKYMTDP